MRIQKKNRWAREKTETARSPWSQSGWWVWNVYVYGGKDFFWKDMF